MGNLALPVGLAGDDSCSHHLPGPHITASPLIKPHRLTHSAHSNVSIICSRLDAGGLWAGPGVARRAERGAAAAARRGQLPRQHNLRLGCVGQLLLLGRWAQLGSFVTAPLMCD